jgi:hypothetical protein
MISGSNDSGVQITTTTLPAPTFVSAPILTTDNHTDGGSRKARCKSMTWNGLSSTFSNQDHALRR